METDRPLLLLSNDDGVQAKGINSLVGMLRPLADIIVMAPDSPRSGAGCSLTSAAAVGYSLVSREDGLTVYACTGTPVDCIKLALHDAVPRRPDLVIGGINHGDNSAVNVHYSGTMGVVMEGCMKGIPSIGFSLCNHRADADFAPLAVYVQGIVRAVLANGLPEGVCLNVNFPMSGPFRGVKVCRQAMGRWENEWADIRHPYHSKYFWLTGFFRSAERMDDFQADGAAGASLLWPDAVALARGYVAITPTRIDVTDYGQARAMQAWHFTDPTAQG